MVKNDGKSELIIKSVEISQNETILEFEFENFPNGYGWVNIDKNSYILDKHSGLKLKLIKSKGVQKSPAKTYLTAGSVIKFKLSFARLSEECTAIDFIEAPGSDFNVYNLKLKNNYAPVKKYEIGDYKNGGIVFMVDNTGKHGLICSQYDLGLFSWYDAKEQCSSASFGGFRDWRLPTKTELIQLYIASIFIEGFKSFPYWSSTMGSNGHPYHVHFDDGSLSLFFEPATKLRVRAIRNF